jgi:hypothetical protein
LGVTVPLSVAAVVPIALADPVLTEGAETEESAGMAAAFVVDVVPPPPVPPVPVAPVAPVPVVPVAADEVLEAGHPSAWSELRADCPVAKLFWSAVNWF